MIALTDEELDAIEARANQPETIGHYSPPPCQHPERGHAPACRRCEIDAAARRGPTFATHGRHDVLALVAEVRRLDNEVENLHLAQTIGPRVAVVNAAVEREALVARVQDVLAGIDEAPLMYAQTPELLASVLSGVHLAAGGNGATWVAAMRACGLTKGNVYLPVTTWEDAKRLAQHLHETAPRWVGTR